MALRTVCVRKGDGTELAGLHVSAEVVAGLERLSTSEWEKPQEFPASAADFG